MYTIGMVRLVVTLLVIGCLAFAGQPLFAADELQPVPLGKVISDLYDYSLGIVGLAAFLMFLLAGLSFIFPPLKDALKIKDPWQIIKDAAIGILLLFSAYLILNSINPDLVGNRTGNSIQNTSR